MREFLQGPTRVTSPPREELVQDGCQGEHVAAVVHRLRIADLLRRHVAGGADQLARERVGLLVGDLGDPKVEELHDLVCEFWVCGTGEDHQAFPPRTFHQPSSPSARC